QKKTLDKEGYEAVQLGFAEKKSARTTKPMQGHFKKSGKECYYHTKEFSGQDLDSYKTGSVVNCSDIFEVGEFVDISGNSKGRGFAGVVKRWGFSGGPASHGSKHGRTGGSIGQSATPSRVIKGMKMPGRMGGKLSTIQNLKVVGINKEENILLIRGAVPGATNSLLVIKKALKKPQVLKKTENKVEEK
ncbi:MAG: 50S ribosomal protein L3, partial [Deltaproteobacteria bacterium]|nr:50S ribosomal protein L3 [Deltaproteobacteria bacterium]